MTKLEELKCPQCGGTDLQTAGYNTFRCNFCGSLSKAVEEKTDNPAPKNSTHYVAPKNENYRQWSRPIVTDDEDDNKSSRFIIGIIVLIVIGIAGILLSVGDEKPVEPSPPAPVDYHLPSGPENPFKDDPFIDSIMHLSDSLK